MASTGCNNKAGRFDTALQVVAAIGLAVSLVYLLMLMLVVVGLIAETPLVMALVVVGGLLIPIGAGLLFGIAYKRVTGV